MKKIFAFLVAMSVTSGIAQSAVPLQEYFRGEYSKAKPGLEKLAKEKNAEALYYLAKIYLDGLDELQNVNYGIQLLEQSAKFNYLPAQMYLGNYFFTHKKSIEAALPWYTSAAMNGNVQAQTFVSLAILNGYGAKRNSESAKKFIIMAAKNGNPMAQYELAKQFLGTKNAQNKMMGKIWIQKAADQNYSDAELLLGKMLYQGVDVPKDKEQGLGLIKKAADGGNHEAQADFTQLTQAINHNQEITLPVNFESDEPKQSLNAEQQWSAMQQAMIKARVPINPVEFVESNYKLQNSGPRLVTITKTMIIRPNYKMTMPESVPISEIITYVSKLSYSQQAPKLILPEYEYIPAENSKDVQDSLKMYQDLALYGHAKSLYMLGKMYENGIGVTKDDKMALMYYLKSAEQNYLKADYSIGRFYLEGKVVGKNYRSALLWLSEAALHGSQNAQYVLGFLYEFGLKDANFSIEKDLNKSVGMYSLASSSGIPEAEYRLAELYSSGVLNPDNNQELRKKYQNLAFQLYQTAAKQGVQPAKLELAYFYAQRNKSAEENKEAFDIASAEHDHKNNKATLLLALLYERGIGTKQDLDTAIDLYDQLAETKNAYAQFALGTYEYLRDKNSHEANSLLTASADDNCVYAQYNLAIVAHQNPSLDDSQQFVDLLKKAAANKYNKASLLLADYYLSANNKENSEHAAALYQELAKQADSTAELKLGFMYEHGIFYPVNNAQAVTWYQSSADHNNPVAQYLLGFFYQIGKGVDRDTKLARSFYTKAAEQQYSPAEIALGYLDQVENNDMDKALSWYKKAAEKGNPVAQYNIAIALVKINDATQSSHKAFSLSLDAAKQGFVPAKNFVAQLYLDGVGTDPEVKQAIAWFSEAADKGSANALYSLGLIAESGVSGQIDTTQAQSYYQAAANQGNVKAEIALARFYQFGTASAQDLQKATSYYQAAAQNGSDFAQYWLNKLSNKAGVGNTTNYCVNSNSLPIATNSVWNSVSNAFRSKPNKNFLLALSCLNEGKIEQGTKQLQTIISEHPNFTPAKLLLQNYSCKTQP